MPLTTSVGCSALESPAAFEAFGGMFVLEYVRDKLTDCRGNI